MTGTDLLLQGIRQEAGEYTVDVEALKIDLPAAFNEWRARLDFRFQSTSHNIDPTLLFDKGGMPTTLRIDADVSQGGIYIRDLSKTEPDHPHAHFQICRFQTDRLGRLTKVTLDAGSVEFFEYMRQLAPHSTVFEKLASLTLSANFPEGRPNYEYFAAHASVLDDQALRLSGRLPDNRA